NYWSDYAVVDNCSGPNQDVCPSPDGIADQPLFVDSCFAPCSTSPYIDHYPLREPFASLVTGTARFAPSSILSQSKSKFMMAIIGLPQGFNASNQQREAGPLFRLGWGIRLGLDRCNYRPPHNPTSSFPRSDNRRRRA